MQTATLVAFNCVQILCQGLPTALLAVVNTEHKAWILDRTCGLRIGKFAQPHIFGERFLSCDHVEQLFGLHFL